MIIIECTLQGVVRMLQVSHAQQIKYTYVAIATVAIAIVIVIQ